MSTTVISNNGRITIPAAIRRKYGWGDGSHGIIAAFSGGFVFSLSDEKSAKPARKALSRGWTLPKPTPLGEFRARVEDWRDLANE